MAGFADSPSVTVLSRSNFDPLIFVLLPRKGPCFIGAPWAVAAPFGPPLAHREPQFPNSGYGLQRPRRAACLLFLGVSTPTLNDAIPYRVCYPKLRQHCCPNPDLAKFFSITQARPSPRLHGRSGHTAILPCPGLGQTRRVPAQGLPESAARLQPVQGQIPRAWNAVYRDVALDWKSGDRPCSAGSASAE